MKSSTRSICCAPTWKPQLPFSSSRNAGAVQPLPARQLMTPLPYSPPMMNAAFFTDGITATQSALPHRSSGMPLSGAFRSSLSTSVAFRSRDVWSA